MNDIMNINDNKIINVENIRGYVDQTTGVVYLNLEDVCIGLGFTTTAPSGNIVVRWNRVQNYLLAIENQGVATSGNGHVLQGVYPEYIPENVFYMLAMKAKSTPAIAFQQKIANEILPMIRRTGMYMTENIYNNLISNPGKLGQMLINYQQQIDQLQEQNELMKPGYEKWNNWLHSKSLYTVHQASHIIGIKGMGLKNLFKYFREHGFVSQDNLAFRQFQDQGLFRVKELDTITKNGYHYHRFQTFLTPFGINYFRDRLISEGYTDLDFVGEPEGFVSEYVPSQIN